MRPDASPVLIFKEHQARPVFHLWGKNSLVDDKDGVRTRLDRSRCGIVYGRAVWIPGVDGSYTYTGQQHVRLRRDHAELFARLCRRCEGAP